MQRSTLLIGCGTAAAGLLETVGTEFAQRGAPAGTLRRLLIVPGTPEASAAPAHPDAIQRVALPLTSDRVTALYYDSAADGYAARAWSSVNWREWGPVLPSLRLYGYLSYLLGRDPLRAAVETAIGGLLPQPGQPLQVSLYLVAHLHDPFASGMVGELAYLLYDTARTYKGSLALLGVLPGPLNDPLTAADSPADARLRQATAYAALRELNFFHSPRDRAGLLPAAADRTLPGGLWRRLEFSPFERGDLYLVGGRNDERGQPLTHNQIAAAAARWIYLQTAQPGPLALHHQRRTALITALNVAQDHMSRAVGSAGQQQVRQQVVTELLRRLLRPGDLRLLPRTARPVLALELATTTAATVSRDEIDRAPVRWLTIDAAALRRELHLREAEYRAEVQTLLQQEAEHSQRLKQLLADQIEQLKADLAARLAQPGITLPLLQGWLAVELDDAARLRDRGDLRGETVPGSAARLPLADLLQESQQYAKRLAVDRQRFFYWVQGLPHQGVIGLLLVLISVPLALLLLLIARDPLAFGLLLIGGIVPPISLMRWLHTRRRRSVTADYEQAQRDLLDQQRVILDQRLHRRFYYRLANTLTLLNQQAAGLETCLREALPTTAIDGLSTPLLQAIDAGWNRLAPRLLGDLWEQSGQAVAHLTPDHIRAVIETHAQAAGIFAQLASDHDLLRERVQAQQAEIGALAADRLGWEGFVPTIGGNAPSIREMTRIYDYSGQTKNSSLAALQALLRVSDDYVIIDPSGDSPVDFRVELGTSYYACTYNVLPLELPTDADAG